MDSAESNRCQCGCGSEIREGSRFKQGHWARVQPKRDFGPAPKCACGCGTPVSHRPGKWLKYADGHYHRARRPWHPEFRDTDPFWSWFAGFTDGEGCFSIAVSSGGHSAKRYPQPCFHISVRADERPILEEIQRRLGCGYIRDHTPALATCNPQLTFKVSAIADCLRLVEVFTLHPLRAKKATDFATWAEAVREKAAGAASNDRLFQLREQLIEGRRFPS